MGGDRHATKFGNVYCTYTCTPVDSLICLSLSPSSHFVYTKLQILLTVVVPSSGLFARLAPVRLVSADVAGGLATGHVEWRRRQNLSGSHPDCCVQAAVVFWLLNVTSYVREDLSAVRCSHRTFSSTNELDFNDVASGCILPRCTAVCSCIAAVYATNLPAVCTGPLR